jgi:hypothetical protein
MTYLVTWSLTANVELGRIASALANPADADREAVWMDTILRRYPFAMGESRFGADRLWYADTLGVWYRIDDNAMTVVILSVGPSRRH